MAKKRGHYHFMLRATPTHFYCIKTHSEPFSFGVAWSGFLYNENGSEWVRLGFYTTKMGRSGSEWSGSKWLEMARSIKWQCPKKEGFSQNTQDEQQ